MMNLMQGDCLEIMASMADDSVDLVLTDPPYKIVAGGCRKVALGDECSGIFNRRKDNNKRTDWVDDVRTGKMFKHNTIGFEAWLPEIYRILKPRSHCYIMVNSRNLSDLQNKAEQAGFKFQNLLIWQKGNVTPNKWYMQGFECILMLRKGGAKNINNMGDSNILNVPNKIGSKLHPTEKPVELMAKLIANSTQDGEIVLDPFMGSNPVGLACVELDRKFIGIELDEDYFTIAKNRIGAL